MGAALRAAVRRRNYSRLSRDGESLGVRAQRYQSTLPRQLRYFSLTQRLWLLCNDLGMLYEWQLLAVLCRRGRDHLTPPVRSSTGLPTSQRRIL